MDACELHVRPLEAIWEEDLVSEAVVTIVSAVNDSIVGRGELLYYRDSSGNTSGSVSDKQGVAIANAPCNLR